MQVCEEVCSVRYKNEVCSVRYKNEVCSVRYHVVLGWSVECKGCTHTFV